MNNSKIKVAVCLVTYNQARYIRESITSALNQKANFQVDILVGNDCSTDETEYILQSIHEKHPNVIVFNRPKNLGLVRNTIAIFQYIFEHDYQYVAMLDGDDFWCDDEKLQRQVDLMEQHPTMSFCYMNATSSKKIARMPKSDMPLIRVENMFNKIRSTGIGNGTVLHRVECLKQVPFDKIIRAELLSMDYPTNVYMAKQGEVGYIDRVSLFWRRTGNTVSSSKEKQRALRYIDHEVRQGLFLSNEFPNTPYYFSLQDSEEFRQWQIYQWALSCRDYNTIRQCIQHANFPLRWLNAAPEKPFLDSKIMFDIYIYIVKKYKTLCRLVGICK